MENWDDREHWITVKDHPDYIVSSLGRVINKKSGRFMTPQLNREHGYLRVYLDGKKYYVHRLVATAFFDCDPTGLDVNHKDGDKLNNAVWNLEWCTRKENIRHALRTGLRHASPNKNYDKDDKIITCRECTCRYEYDWCEDKPDNFFCAFAEHNIFGDL